MKDTFTLWTTLSKEGTTGEFFLTRKGAKMWREKGEKIVKLECRIVQPQRKPKKTCETTIETCAGCGMQQPCRNDCPCGSIIQLSRPKRKPKRGKYPNDNFGLPAGYTPHNPDNLTREQVGEGFRLLADVEIGRHRSFSNDTQAWHTARWDDIGWCGCLPPITYRVPINTPLDINPELKQHNEHSND